MTRTSSPSTILMSDSARQPDVEIFVIVASPSISPDENPMGQRNATRRAFRIFRSFSALMDPIYRPREWLPVSGGDSLVHGYESPVPEEA